MNKDAQFSGVCCAFAQYASVFVATTVVNNLAGCRDSRITNTEVVVKSAVLESLRVCLASKKLGQTYVYIHTRKTLKLTVYILEDVVYLRSHCAS